MERISTRGMASKLSDRGKTTGFHAGILGREGTKNGRAREYVDHKGINLVGPLIPLSSSQDIPALHARAFVEKLSRASD
jgi:hypothetical protein